MSPGSMRLDETGLEYASALVRPGFADTDDDPDV
jgi:hypothetical protein